MSAGIDATIGTAMLLTIVATMLLAWVAHKRGRLR